MSTIFKVTAYDGRTIRLSEAQWHHITFFHPEIQDQQKKITQVIQNPKVVLEGATKDTRICYRFYPSTPVTSKYLAVIIKLLNREGFIITSYFTQRMRKGVVLWRETK